MCGLSMESLSSKYLSWILLLLLVQICRCKGCNEEEKIGLLEFKAFLKLNDEKANLLLPSWLDNNINDCCSWERVICDPTTDRVKKLSLNNIRQRQIFLEDYGWAYYKNDKFWLLNTSLFLPFEELHDLNLSANSFDGFIKNEGFKSLSSLKKLEILDISGNEFDKSVIKSLSTITSLKTLILCSIELEGSFPVKDSQSLSILKKLETLNLNHNKFKNTTMQQLNTFTSLKSLSLQSNYLGGFFPIQELCTLENLVMLDLSWNHLTGMQGFKSLSKLRKLEILNLGYNLFNKTIVKQLSGLTSLKTLVVSNNYIEGFFPSQDFASLSNLEVLDLSNNSFSGIVPSSIRLMSSLKSLYLAGNHLNGSLPNKGFCQLNKLQELDLNSNFFQGILPPCLNNLTSLRLLDLSYNLFSGNVSSSLLSNLTSLEYIDLSYNQFEGSFSFSSFANHSKLQVVILRSDNNKFEIETEYPVGWVPLFQLKAIVLSNCKLIGDLPRFLQYQFRLTAVDLSHNNLTGSFLNWLLENNTRLEFLILRNNSLMGQLLPLTPNTIITLLDISDNRFDGQLQEKVGHMIPNMEYLNLSNNGFEGILPSSIAKMTSLVSLDLSANSFSGEVPKQLLAVKDLAFLKLSNNKFHGEIFSRDFNLTSLESLHLDNNQFRGTLSNVLSKSSWLEELDVSNNNMSGEIPSWIGNMTDLTTLVLGNNGFKGKLPHEISQLQWLEFLDVSQNALLGSLPSLKSMEYLKHLHLQGNMFTGLIPRDFLNSSNLLTLDIRDNKLFGSIPNSISALLEMRILLLRGNLFSGFIPNQLCHLTKISLMDLSNNNFSGSIPKCFGHIQFGDFKTEHNVYKPMLDWHFERIPSIYTGYLTKHLFLSGIEQPDEVDEVEFVTKNRSGSYRGGILDFMSGLDLSCNNLTGEIPHELGMLSLILALNLSHNQLKGPIPKSFSNLSQIESLDLSYNKLSGEIPPELIGLNFLEVFSVAHNNISGRVPDLKAQFGTFGESSYEDNPFLCGPMLKRICNTSIEPPYSPPKSSRESEAKWYDINRVVFFASFATSYMMILLGIVTILYINPYWRQRWFNFIEECIYSFYYFASDTYSKLLAYLYN
ncbi:hypothetical protein PVL29_011956 [Vitis rotundifolia]|uniref:Leucine-rich repeat-containing N-terminal plant-type domain-containing protein n=1 Tax=Vitis rotundifolia TaxID=103349 RepID=A0AA38ZRG9_VITRO|nr:hypothetical protein PVL29_011956 [Vitis rotundifolia]